MSTTMMEKVKALSPELAERAARIDGTATFVFESYRAMKDARLFSAGVPTSLGGGGATHAELCRSVRVLARSCPSTALAFSMHTHLVAGAVWRHNQGQKPASALLSKVAKEECVLVTTGANDWLDSNGSATPTDGGYVVSAQKRFASGAPAGNIVFSSAVSGDEILHFAVPLDTPGLRVEADWDTLGMRGTGSQSLTFENVFVPAPAISVRRPRHAWHPSFNVLCAIAIPIYLSAYLGAAEEAKARCLDALRRRSGAPAHVVGEMENAFLIAETCWESMIAASDNYQFDANIEIANRMLSLKTIVAKAVRGCVDRAVELAGGSAYFKKNALERLWRDVQAVQFHPLPEQEQLQFSGRLALGADPVTGVRKEEAQ